MLKKLLALILSFVIVMTTSVTSASANVVTSFCPDYYGLLSPVSVTLEIILLSGGSWGESIHKVLWGNKACFQNLQINIGKDKLQYINVTPNPKESELHKK